MLAVLYTRPLDTEKWVKRTTGFHVYATYFYDDVSVVFQKQTWLLKKGRVYDSVEHATRFMRAYALHNQRRFEGVCIFRKPTVEV